MNWRRLRPHLMQHLCTAFPVTRDDDGNQQGRMVQTVFPEERCPYCKQRAPDRGKMPA